MRLVVRSDHRLGGGCVGLRTLDPTDSELRVEARFQPGHEVLEAPTGVCDGATRSTNLGRLQDSVAVGHHDHLDRLVDPLGVGQLSQPVVDRRKQARLGDEDIRGVVLPSRLHGQSARTAQTPDWSTILRWTVRDPDESSSGSATSTPNTPSRVPRSSATGSTKPKRSESRQR